MKEVMKNTLYVLVAVLFVIALCSIESAIVMWLWNNVITYNPEVKELTVSEEITTYNEETKDLTIENSTYDETTGNLTIGG